MEKLISVEHINKYFGSFKAIDDISFELDGGKIYGIIGPNICVEETGKNHCN